ncbi:hypothetical protein D3C81_2104290 [compost metagenome]
MLDAGEVALLRCGGNASPYGIEVDIDHAGQQGRLGEQRLAFEAALPEVALAAIFLIGLAGQRLVQQAHQPADGM